MIPTHPLSDALQYIRGVTFDPVELVAGDVPGAIACMRTKNVQKALDESDLIYVPKSVVKRDEQMLRAGDLLISSANSWELVGKTVRVNELAYPATAGGFISILRPNHGMVDPNYLYRFIAWDNTQHVIRHMGRQTTNISNLDRERFLTLPIPLPPLLTQKHIARVLEQADQLRKQAQQMESALNQLAQSLFLEMFGDLVSNARNWPKEVLGKHAKRITVGHVGVTSEHYTENGISFLRTQNVRPMRVNFSDIKQITPQFHESLKKSTLKQGDVLVSRVGANRGMACIVPPVLDGANCANVLIARLADSISPVFVSYLINGDYGARTLLGDSVGSAQGVINTQKLQEWVLPFPPITLQKKFELSYEKIQSQLDAVASKKDALDDLFNALIQRAFNGELTAPERKAA